MPLYRILYFDLEADPNKEMPIIKRHPVTRAEAAQHVLAAYPPDQGWIWVSELNYQWFENGSPTAEVELQEVPFRQGHP